MHKSLANLQAAAVLAQSPLQPSIGSQVEERLRRSSQTGRIRFSEFFKDYDPLKSGVITSMLFHFCNVKPVAYHTVFFFRNAVLSVFGPAPELETK